jgi:hypothetical protein
MTSFRLMRTWPTVSAAVLTAALIVTTLFGCFLALIAGAPSEPCPDDPSTVSWIRPVMFLLSLTVVLAAITSIVVAWWGVASGRTQPFLIGAASGLALSTALSILILVVLNEAGKC